MPQRPSTALAMRQGVSISAAIKRARGWFRSAQRPEGFWLGRLHSNSCMEAQWVMLQHVLGLGASDPKFPGVVRAILRERREDGSWGIYPGAEEGDINTTVECYAALRIAGHAPADAEMTRTRGWISAHGGLPAIRNFTRYWLALIGEWPWDDVPTLPPELIAAPRWFPFNLYRFASWARGTMVPLLVLSARRLSRPLPPEARLDELFERPRGDAIYKLSNTRPGLTWDSFFATADRILNLYQRFMPLKPGREAAIRLCLEWMLKHQEADGAWSGIQPPWVYSLMALHAEGYALDHPVLAAGLRAFDGHWKWEEDGAIYMQASLSPVWDTALTLQALLDCEPGPTLGEDRSAIERAVDWLLEQQILAGGDWQVFGPEVAPGGWAFEFANDAYPDTDDTAIVLIVLQRLREAFPHGPRREAMERAITRALSWLVGMQSSNGGWGAFDVDNDSKIITRIPFCDFGEVLDPPSVDVTAHVLEALALAGRRLGDSVVDRAVGWTFSEQEPEGSWFGRWGCNHVYGVGSVLPALAAVGVDMREPRIRKAGRWLAAHQNADGGWGETCASYMDDAQRGRGPSTASQTAWGLHGLLSLDDPEMAEAIAAGVRWLLRAQRPDGTWEEEAYTATGFPGYGVGERIRLDPSVHERLGQDANLQRAFMIKYDMYRLHFPLSALGRAESWLARQGLEAPRA